MNSLKKKTSKSDNEIKKIMPCNNVKSVNKCKTCSFYNTWSESCGENDDPKTCGGPYN